MFSDEKWMSARQKEAVLRDWRQFIRHGFRKEDFTEAIYHHLIRHAAFIAHYDRPTFWETYFDHDFGHFARFINQFGGDLRSAELGLPDWMASHTGADLNDALVTEMRLLFEVFITVLEEEAIAAHEAEKWTELRELNPEADSQRMQHLAMIYEDLYPLRDYAQYGPVTEDVRAKLRRAVRHVISAGAAPTLFEARATPPSSAQASAFERDRTQMTDTTHLAVEETTSASYVPEETEVWDEHPAG